jgi:hypothetical protein
MCGRFLHKDRIGRLGSDVYRAINENNEIAKQAGVARN